MEYAVLFTMGIAFLIAILSGPLVIPFLRKLKYGQQVRSDGPQSHLKKQGTPTMGGVIILLAVTLAILPFVDHKLETYILFIATLGYGFVGFLDDYIKILFKRSLGLTAMQKIAGQGMVAIIVCVMLFLLDHSTTIHIPLTHIDIPLAWMYFPLMVFIMIGGSNAVNFTDGLDGLLAGTSAIAFGAYALIALYQSQPDIALFCGAMIGAVLGFLIFNKHPAKIFMGDTGSLAIGGGLVAVSILTKSEVLLAVIGGVFLIESLSVAIQVISFKTRGKRIFKMSPIHHHFELVGWSEWRVVLTFWFAGFVLAIAGLWISGVL
jgi:phospho-N-acetylmuramoyl-pentapeptide-transferase